VFHTLEEHSLTVSEYISLFVRASSKAVGAQSNFESQYDSTKERPCSSLRQYISSVLKWHAFSRHLRARISIFLVGSLFATALMISLLNYIAEKQRLGPPHSI
jgi:hypothetical protein